MFTGIIKNQGVVADKQPRGGQIRFTFGFVKKEKAAVKAGESIAVDGVCLTATKVTGRAFSVDVIRETLASTTLSRLRIGDRVNLERSLKVGDEIGGHFVTGHVDGIGQIVKVARAGKNYTLHFKAPRELALMLAKKGSVAVDGISLTVQALGAEIFEIGIIPYTFTETTLGLKKVGDYVNLEIDILTRYLKSMLDAMKESGGFADKRLRARLIRQGF